MQSLRTTKSSKESITFYLKHIDLRTISTLDAINNVLTMKGLIALGPVIIQDKTMYNVVLMYCGCTSNLTMNSHTKKIRDSEEIKKLSYLHNNEYYMALDLFLELLHLIYPKSPFCAKTTNLLLLPCYKSEHYTLEKTRGMYIVFDNIETKQTSLLEYLNDYESMDNNDLSGCILKFGFSDNLCMPKNRYKNKSIQIYYNMNDIDDYEILRNKYENQYKLMIDDKYKKRNEYMLIGRQCLSKNPDATIADSITEATNVTKKILMMLYSLSNLSIDSFCSKLLIPSNNRFYVQSNNSEIKEYLNTKASVKARQIDIVNDEMSRLIHSVSTEEDMDLLSSRFQTLIKLHMNIDSI